MADHGKENDAKAEKLKELIDNILNNSVSHESKDVDTKGESEILSAISKLDILYEINIATANTSEARLVLDKRMALVNELRLMRQE